MLSLPGIGERPGLRGKGLSRTLRSSGSVSHLCSMVLNALFSEMPSGSYGEFLLIEKHLLPSVFTETGSESSTMTGILQNINELRLNFGEAT